MSNFVAAAKEQLAALITSAYESAVAEGLLAEGAKAPEIEASRDPSFGDWSSGFALASAKALGKSPRDIAALLIDRVELTGTFFSELTMAGPGFLNARLSDLWFYELLNAIEDEGDGYGSVDVGQGRSVMVEFVSANPTGPMTIGNARGGVLGDTLAEVLHRAGYKVWREFYCNDTGNQVDLLGRSLEARYLQKCGVEVPFPEDGYHGDDIAARADEFIAEQGDALVHASEEQRRQTLIDFALPKNIEKMRADLARYRIRYDRFFYETELHKSGYVDETLDKLTAAGHTYEQDGAVWFKATAFGAEKDDVLRKSNGFLTYYAVDIAYHRDKFEKRGFDMVIDVLGADHHGHTLRFASSMAALGIDPTRLRFVLMQLVRLTREGEVVRVSKRTGKAITLSDLLDEIPVDAARFFFNARAHDSHLEFDMDLAVRQDSENPVYYVQYAHARISSLLNTLADEGHAPPPAAEIDVSLLTDESERALLRALAAYPEEIRLSAVNFDPSRINRYCVELAGHFHRFYHAQRIRGAESGVLEARLKLALTTCDVLKNALGVLGIDAPEKM